jgi:hypothetical protein
MLGYGGRRDDLIKIDWSGSGGGNTDGKARIWSNA